MNSIVGPIFIFYDKDICKPETLVNNYLCMFNKKALMENNEVFISKDIDGIMIIRFKTNETIRFVPINNFNARGYRALVALVPEHWKNSDVVEYYIKPMMYSNFISFYDQKEFCR